MFRLAISPFLLIFLIPNTTARAIVLALLILGEISDFLDGIAARRKNEVSDFGKLIDPMADVIFHLTLFLIFMALNLVPAWMVILLVWREVAVSSLRLLASTDESVVIAAAKPGKVKTNVQAVVCFLVMGAYLLGLPATNDIAFWGTLACVFASLYSGAFYFFGYRRVLASVYRRSRPAALREGANVILRNGSDEESVSPRAPRATDPSLRSG